MLEQDSTFLQTQKSSVSAEMDPAALLMQQLQKEIQNYLDLHPRLSINALSLKSGVSEPTLRRIMNDQVKNVPTIENILAILNYIYKPQSLHHLLSLVKAPLSEYLREKIPAWPWTISKHKLRKSFVAPCMMQPLTWSLS